MAGLLAAFDLINNYCPAYAFKVEMFLVLDKEHTGEKGVTPRMIFGRVPGVLCIR